MMKHSEVLAKMPMKGNPVPIYFVVDEEEHEGLWCPPEFVSSTRVGAILMKKQVNGRGWYTRDKTVVANFANEFMYGQAIGDDDDCKNILLEEIFLKSSQQRYTKGLRVEEMDKVIIKEEAKSEIISVLKQHQHSHRIFKEWGLEDVIEYGRGMTFLFYGPPGTGKTWAAHCIAKTMKKELLIISPAEIQSSEPGGANRAIQEAFSKAKSGRKVLFIDECDSLVSSRDNLGMILGGEVNTLLTEIEKYEGVVVLATNKIENLDSALERRISLIIEFPDPDFWQRIEIWRRMLPPKMPVESTVTPEALAEYKLTGGQIKNVVLNAARMAVSAGDDMVKLEHFATAIKRLNSSKSLMGSASRWRQQAILDTGKGAGRGEKQRRPSADVDVGKDKADVEVEKVESTDKVKEIKPEETKQ